MFVINFNIINTEVLKHIMEINMLNKRAICWNCAHI